MRTVFDFTDLSFLNHRYRKQSYLLTKFFYMNTRFMKAIAVVGISISLCNSASAQIVVKIRPNATRVVTTRPVAPSPRHVWVNGDYVVRNNQYEWTEGRWVEPRAHTRWVDGHWKRNRRGWVWVPGHWQRA